MQVADSFTTAHAAISLDYHLALKMIRRPDFVEGVRALLVDKDKAPKWSPNRLELVDNDLLKEVFNQTVATLKLMTFSSNLAQAILFITLFLPDITDMTEYGPKKGNQMRLSQYFYLF